MALFEDICSYNNLILAFDRVEENAGSHGVDNVTIEDFSVNLQNKIFDLRKNLLNGTYLPSDLRKVGITKSNGKIRWLAIPVIRDRIIQTSAAMILSPILDIEFEECSYAYRKNRSVQKAIYKIIELRDKGYSWVVDADIYSFFDEIDHEILIEELKKYINDKRVIELIKKWLNVDIIYKNEITKLTKGVPQGSPISPLLSNLYLDSFDEALMKGKFKHVRFADDFVILCKDKPHAEDAVELTGEVLKKLKLNLNEEKTHLIDFNHGFKFLGVEFLRSIVYRPIYADELELPEINKELVITPKNILPEIKHSCQQASTKENINSHIPPFIKDGLKADLQMKSNKKIQPKSIIAKPSDKPMEKAFKDAFNELEKENREFIFHEKLEIEPTATGDTFLRTLYLLEQGSVLKKEDERFIVAKDGNTIKEIPAIKIDQILVFGNIQITTQAMKFCLEQNIPIILLSSRGKYFGVVESFQRTDPHLHKRQFEIAGDKKSALEIAKAIVEAKINNSKVLIQRYVRKRPNLNIDAEIQNINNLLNKIPSVKENDELMGVEGAASANYFSVLRMLIGSEWKFTKRQKQPPPDPINSMLSYGYTLLFYNIYAMIRIYKLHPYVGFLHGMKEGHPSLVSDLIEEFRAPVVDSVVLNLIVRGSLKKDDFIFPENEGAMCLLKDDARKIFIKSFEGKMNSSILHEATGSQVDYRRYIDLQVQALRRVIDGKAQKYEPMRIK